MLARPFRKAFSSNQNASSFTAKVAKFAKPSGSGVIELATTLGGMVPSKVRIIPYGLGSENDVFSLRVWGWVPVGSGDNPNLLWVPSSLGEFSCTISASVGVAGAPVLNTERFADTISIVATVGEATITADTTRLGTVELFSPANDTPGWIVMPTRGVTLLEFDTDQTTNTPTANALLQFLD